MFTSRFFLVALGLLALPAAAVAQPKPVRPGPSAAAVECPGLDYDVETGLAGLVRGADETVTIPNAFVVASWTDSDGARNTRTAEAGLDGVYVMCGLPTNTPISVRAGFADYSSDATTVRIEPGPPAGWDFEIEVDEGSFRGDAAFPGRIVGTVIDRRTDRPVESAQLELVGDDENRLSDGNGRFLFRDLTPGVYRVAVSHIAYERMEQIVNVPGNRTVDVRFSLSADPIELEPLVVTVVRDNRLERRGYYERRDIGEKVGNGVFFNAEEIRRLMPSRVTNLLEWVPGVRVDCSGGSRSCRVIMTRGAPSLSSRGEVGCVNSNIYVDGVRVVRDTQDSPESIDSFVSPFDIAGMEVYRSASEVPAEFAGSVGRCGAIVIWTGSGG
ncbi:MAG: carboxypeptidase regulatory-like domain-containing protein [Gemmatimonadota bacterium]